MVSRDSTSVRSPAVQDYAKAIYALERLATLTGRRDVMGAHVNRRLTTVLAWSCAVLITGLNLFLIYQQLFGG